MDQKIKSIVSRRWIIALLNITSLLLLVSAPLAIIITLVLLVVTRGYSSELVGIFKFQFLLSLVIVGSSFLTVGVMFTFDILGSSITEKIVRIIIFVCIVVKLVISIRNVPHEPDNKSAIEDQ